MKTLLAGLATQDTTIRADTFHKEGELKRDTAKSH